MWVTRSKNWGYFGILVDCISFPFRLLTPLTASSGFSINLRITSTGVGTNLSTPVSTNKLKIDSCSTQSTKSGRALLATGWVRQATRIAVSKPPCNFWHRDSISDRLISFFKWECWIIADYLHSKRLEVTSVWSIYYPVKQWEQSYRYMLALCSAFADKRHAVR